MFLSQVSTDGGTRKSAVAEALGTKFELPVNKQLSHSKSSGQVTRVFMYLVPSSRRTEYRMLEFI